MTMVNYIRGNNDNLFWSLKNFLSDEVIFNIFHVYCIDQVIGEGDLKGPVSGFVHNISNIKENENKTRWFNCDIQTEKGVVRAISFDTSRETITHYSNAAEKVSCQNYQF